MTDATADLRSALAELEVDSLEVVRGLGTQLQVESLTVGHGMTELGGSISIGDGCFCCSCLACCCTGDREP
jgi:hypothetical protein